ncbi:hypothetical protein [Crossiella sp. CA198]|uniref:hypothetical protein n=1 Tax=Crossiella sp. CA198 TaxID=3455607 RepID=UPI003F8D5482
MSLAAAAIQTAEQHLRAAVRSMANQQAQHTPATLAEIAELLRAVPITGLNILNHRVHAAEAFEQDYLHTRHPASRALPPLFRIKWTAYREKLLRGQKSCSSGDHYLGRFAADLRELDRLRLRHNLMPGYPDGANAGLHLQATGVTAPAGIQAIGALEAAEQSLEAVGAAFRRPQPPARASEQMELFRDLVRKAAHPVGLRIYGFVNGLAFGGRAPAKTQELLEPVAEAARLACSHLGGAGHAVSNPGSELEFLPTYLPSVDAIPDLRL